MNKAIEVRNLHKHFGAQHVLKGLSFDVYEGEKLVILGRSGGGKSVLLRHIAGLVKPDSGEVRIFGQDMVPLRERELNPIRRGLGMLFQNAALFDSMTVMENISFPLVEEGKLDPAQIRKKVMEALAWVDLKDAENKMPSQLSGGMRKRVGLARALMVQPRIVLYDEPTAGLDPIVSDSINNLIIKVSEDFKVTSITVTHDMVSAYKIADRIIMLHHGNIHFVGTPEETRACRDPIVYDFVNGISKDLPTIEL